MIDNNVNQYMFPQLMEHREAIKGGYAQIRQSKSQVECVRVKSCISNTKNISVKLNDLRNAKDHAVSEFFKGVFSVIGGALAIAVLASFHAITFGKVIPEEFSAMVDLVKRGAARCGNATNNNEKLDEEIENTLEDLNTTLEDLPTYIDIVKEIRTTLADVKSHIGELRNFELVNDITVKEDEGKPVVTGLFGKISTAPSYYDTLMAKDADKFRFVELVKELTSIANFHFNDVNEELQTSLIVDIPDDEFNNDVEINAEDNDEMPKFVVTKNTMNYEIASSDSDSDSDSDSIEEC